MQSRPQETTDLILRALTERQVALIVFALALGTFAIGTGEFGSNGIEVSYATEIATTRAMPLQEARPSAVLRMSVAEAEEASGQDQPIACGALLPVCGSVPQSNERTPRGAVCSWSPNAYSRKTVRPRTRRRTTRLGTSRTARRG